MPNTDTELGASHTGTTVPFAGSWGEAKPFHCLALSQKFIVVASCFVPDLDPADNLGSDSLLMFRRIGRLVPTSCSESVDTREVLLEHLAVA